MEVAFKWILTCNYVVLLSVSLFTFILVVFIRKRRDLFVVSALACYIVVSIIQVSFYIHKLVVDNGFAGNWEANLLAFGRFCYLIAHWTFSAQYLKTSMVLPRVLQEAKLEYAGDNTIEQNRLSNRSSAHNSARLLQGLEGAINSEKK